MNILCAGVWVDGVPFGNSCALSSFEKLTITTEEGGTKKKDHHYDNSPRFILQGPCSFYYHSAALIMKGNWGELFYSMYLKSENHLFRTPSHLISLTLSPCQLKFTGLGKFTVILSTLLKGGAQYTFGCVAGSWSFCSSLGGGGDIYAWENVHLNARQQSRMAAGPGLLHIF